MVVTLIPPAAEHPKNRRRVGILSALLILAAGIGIVSYFKLAHETNSGDRLDPPVIGQVADFSLTERSNQKISLSSLKGKIWIADFIFATCAGTCPIMTERMNLLNRELQRDGIDDIHFVSISVDPERDTPQSLRFYANLYHADPTKWLFLTGDVAQMENLAINSFKVAQPSAAPGEDQILHSSNYFLVDQEGRVRGSYRALTNEEEMDLVQVSAKRGMPDSELRRLMADIRKLLR